MDDHSMTALLPDLLNYNDHALRGLLRTHGMRADGKRMVLVDRIRSGNLTASDIGDWLVRLRDIDEAIASCRDFKQTSVFISDYRASENLPVTGPLDLLVDDTRNKLYATDLDFDRYISFNDERRAAGRQHIFLFTVDGIPDRIRNTLRSEEEFRAFLEDRGLAEIYGTHKSLWRATTPTPVSIMRHGTAIRTTWVGSREIVHGGKTYPMRTLVTFRLDWERREAELRIERKPGSPNMKQVRKEFDAYCGLLKDLFGQIALGPVLMGPALRELIATNELDAREYRILLPHGGRIDGRNIPRIVSYARRAFRNYYVKSLSCTWETGGRRINTSFNADINELYIHDECAEEALESLTRRIRMLSTRSGHGMPKPSRKTIPAGATPNIDVNYINKVNEYLSTIDTWQFEFRQLKAILSDMWIPYQKFIHVVDGLDANQALSPTYHFDCPDTKRPVMTNGHRLEFHSFEDIPAMISCGQHDPPEKHRAMDCLRISFRHTPAPPDMRRPLIIVTILITEILLVVWFFSWLLSRYDLPPLGVRSITLGLLLCQCLILAMAIRLTGLENFKSAVDLLKDILKLRGTS